MTQLPSRRSVLGMMATFGAALAAGLYVWKNSPEALVGKILANRFPGLKVDGASVAALTRDLKNARFQTWGRRLALESGARAAAVVGLDALAQWKLTATSFSQLERKIVTFFILGSDFLDVADPKSDRVTYGQLPLVCPNRFAEYD